MLAPFIRLLSTRPELQVALWRNTQQTEEKELTNTCLLLEVTDRKFIGKSEEMQHVVLEVVILQMVHQVSSIALQKNQRDSQ